MPAISKIRLTNVQYEQGNKRYNDELFLFDGHNGAVLLENGGGKTVFIQSVIQAMVPNGVMADRKIRDTLDVTGSPAHIAVEWILGAVPRHYALTCITFYMGKEGLEYLLYAYDYPAGDKGRIEKLPFVQNDSSGKRPAGREEIKEYYQKMAASSMNAKTFETRQEYQHYLEQQFQIVSTEWEAILKINSKEGGVEDFFDHCKTTGQLVDNLLIPVVEQGMAGNGTGDFAKTFDNQRHQFREYLALNEQIQEYQQVQGQIARIIDRYAELYRQEEIFLRCKSQAKGLYKYVMEEWAGAEAEQQDVAETGQRLQERQAYWQRKKASLKIAYLKQELSEIKQRLDLLSKEKETRKAAYQACHGRLESLQHALKKENIKEKQERLHFLQGEMETLEQSPDVENLKEQLKELLAGLRYLYDQQEADLLGQQQVQQGRQQELERQEQQLGRDLEQLRQELREIELAEAKTAGDLKNTQEQMVQLQVEILDDPRRETVPQQIPLWQTRLEQVAVDLQDLLGQIKENKQAREQNRLQQQQVQGELVKANMELTRANERLAAIHREEERLLEKLHRLSPQDREIISLYRRQPTVQHRLAEELARLDLQHDHLLEKERVLLRLFDLYKDNQVFTADPALEKWVEKNQAAFPSLQLGTSFVAMAVEEQMGTSLEQLFARYPLWPISVVVSQGEVARLQQLLARQGDRWTHPIFILSEQEARQRVISGSDDFIPQVTPANWPEISHPDRFQEWLKAQGLLAGEVTAERKACAHSKQQWQTLDEEICNFWQQYDHQEIYQPLKEAAEKLKRRCQELQEAQNSLGKLAKELEQKNEEAGRRRESLEQEQNNLSDRLRQAGKWQQLEAKRQEANTQLEQLAPRKKQKEGQLERIGQTMEECKGRIKRQQSILRDIAGSLIALRAEAEYREVRQLQGSATDLSLDMLKEQKAAVAGKLAGWQQNRASLERQSQGLQKEINRLQEELHTHLEAYGEVIDQELLWPTGGELEIKRLTTERKKLKQEQEQAAITFGGVDREYTKQKTKIEEAAKHYRETFPAFPVVDFTESFLTRVEEELQQEQKKLATEKHLLEQRRQEVSQLQKQLEQVKQKLEVAQGIYHYLPEAIPATPLTLKELQEYPYRRLEFTAALIKELELARGETLQQQAIVDKARKEFEDYCDRQIRDEKTRQQSLNGIRLKNTYREVKEWGEQMQERIRAASNILEEHIRTLDQQVQHFVAHLHNHLVRICEELQTIPKMTAVKVDDRKKLIYDFTVPAWQKQEGWAKLRRHLEWMIKELEKDTYKTDQGFEDSAKIKKQIENWLHPKQLLQVIDSSQEIKVRCRKVNSDTHVSSTFTEWPKTEKWSGGEKWSKNMTLFLGILNYLAEKRQHLRRGEENHRVVLVDNPFGKASSDHVLAPVFFIAKQLGFQILALTAHAEGKFLKDHFPVIYSCRLRPTKDPSISVMTKEKEISQAYFQDHDPFEIERLGEEEQLSLF